MGQTLLELKNISKTYHLESGRELVALSEVNFEIREGEILALLGPSGSGKSTCLRIMCGLQEANAGQVLSEGKEHSGVNENVSIVFQTFALFPWETVQKNIELALFNQNLSDVKLRQKVKSVIDLVGLEGYEEAYPRELSGGMKQRVGVARALVSERPILFLDEPFSALDILTADTLRDEILNIFHSKKTKIKSMLLVTHNIQEVVMMADRILVMSSNPGKIKAEFVNRLSHPRDPDSRAFQEFVAKIHNQITEAYIPDEQVGGGKGSQKYKNRFEVLPDVQILDIVGLIEAIFDEKGAVDVFDLCSDLGKDFGQTLYLVKAAELLNFVDTPKQKVILTKWGQKFAEADTNTRKKMVNESFKQLHIVKKTTELLNESENLRIPVEDLSTQLHEWLPNENPETQIEVLVSWGRYAEYFGYNDNSKSIYLDTGEEI